MTTDPAIVAKVAKAICKSRTCEGFSCCQWPANRGRVRCPVKNGGYTDAATDAIAAYESALREAAERLRDQWRAMIAAADTGEGK